MTTVLSSSDVRPSADSSSAGWLRKFAREPLLHFLILGAVLFAADAFIASREEDPHSIVVGAEVDEEAKRVFESARGRAPDAKELQALRQVWLDNEVLYREGLALGLDKGDATIRERVIFKALSMVDAGTRLPSYDDQMLRSWFEKNRVKYDEPARFDFQEAVLAGDSSEATVRAFVSALNSGTPPDSEAGLRVFTGRPHGNLVQSYGVEFAVELEALPRKEWRAIKSRDGWRAMRLESITPSVPAKFEQVRGVVTQDWTDATLSGQRSTAVRALAQKYTIRYEGDAK
jgi:hypothetical protein